MLTIVLAALLGSAGERAGVIGGFVRDDSSRAIESAEVILIRAPKTLTARVRTDSGGRFSFAVVAAGSYRLEARILGFAPETLWLSLSSTDTVDVSITLKRIPFELASIIAEGERERPGFRSARPTMNRVGQEEIAVVARTTVNLNELLSQVRPFWFPRRDARVSVFRPAPVIYINSWPAPEWAGGDTSWLYRVSPSAVQSIDYYNASEAFLRFGLASKGRPVLQIWLKDGSSATEPIPDAGQPPPSPSDLRSPELRIGVLSPLSPASASRGRVRMKPALSIGVAGYHYLRSPRLELQLAADIAPSVHGELQESPGTCASQCPPLATEPGTRMHGRVSIVGHTRDATERSSVFGSLGLGLQAVIARQGGCAPGVTNCLVAFPQLAGVTGYAGFGARHAIGALPPMSIEIGDIVSGNGRIRHDLMMTVAVRLR